MTLIPRFVDYRSADIGQNPLNLFSFIKSTARVSSVTFIPLVLAQLGFFPDVLKSGFYSLFKQVYTVYFQIQYSGNPKLGVDALGHAGVLLEGSKLAPGVGPREVIEMKQIIAEFGL